MHIPKSLLFTATILIALSAVFALPAALDKRQAPTSQVTGTCSDGSELTGTFVPKNFLSEGPTGLSAAGTLTKAACGSKALPDTDVTFPVESVNGKTGTAAKRSLSTRAPACNVLNLVLGPLDLNLLGLEVHLKQVILDILARPGAGALLGNLLCSVAGLLDGGAALGQLAGLLNQILGLLGGLLGGIGGGAAPAL
ncbi:hypothetical protein HK104_008881 [Borealophlyctis nickersoniae]|nr:hypothetical protein HK104_008881 [Borealophlyctis nickersoniae]